jgi:hypothetical protein
MLSGVVERYYKRAFDQPHYALRPALLQHATLFQLSSQRLALFSRGIWGEVREVYRPKGLLAFAAAAREYVRLL